MSAELKIRHATSSDVEAVRSCVQLAYEPYTARIGRKPAPMLADYDQLVKQGRVHVADNGQRIVGVVVMWTHLDHVNIDNIATHPDVRGTGVGRSLLEWAELRALEEGHREIRLYTNAAMRENLSYYERQGFLRTGQDTEDGYDRIYFSRRLDMPS